jgi:hypothetical protein
MRHRVTISTRRMIAAHLDEGEDGIECVLEREPLNLHDENAIKVIITNGPYDDFHLGYIAKEVAAKLAPKLDAGKALFVYSEIEEMDAQEGTATLLLTLKTHGKAIPRKSKKKT